MFEVYMTWILNYFFIFEQYSFSVGFKEEFEKKCTTHDTVQKTTLIFPPKSSVLLTSVRHPCHLCQHTTHLTHNGTSPKPPTLIHNPRHPRSTTSQTLARNQRHPSYSYQRAIHTCILPTLAFHPRKQVTILARHQRKHVTLCNF